MPKKRYRKRPGLLSHPLAIAAIALCLGLVACVGALSPGNSVKDGAAIIFWLAVGGVLILLGVSMGLSTLMTQRLQEVSLQQAMDNRPVKRPSELTSAELEELAARVFARLGYKNVKHTGAHSSTDGGVDVWMLSPDGHVEIVQCKQLSARVDKSELVAFAKTMRQQHAVRGWFWAPGQFTQPAIDYAAQHNIQVCEEDRIMRQIEKADRGVPIQRPQKPVGE